MAKRRKYTKKWLKKPDEFITIFDQAISFISRYQKSLIWGMAGVVLVGSAIGVLLYFQKITERELEGSIVEAHFLYLQAETSNKGDFTEALQAFQAVVQKFPRQYYCFLYILKPALET